VRPWKRRLSDDERSVLLSELLLRHPELAVDAEEITSTLLVVENEQELADEITAKLRALTAGTGGRPGDSSQAWAWMQAPPALSGPLAQQERRGGSVLATSGKRVLKSSDVTIMSSWDGI